MGYPPSPTPFARAMLNIKFKIALAASLSFLPLSALLAIEYTSANTEPQKTGWPVTPTAGYRGKDVGHTRWLDIHAKLVAEVQAHEDSTDILLLGDSITECMGRQRDQWPAVPIPLEKAFWASQDGQRRTLRGSL